MPVDATAGATFTARVTRFATGLTGTVAIRVVNADTGAVVVASTTSGITETGTGIYKTTTAVAPNTAGDYEIEWDNGSGLWDATEDLTVTGEAQTVLPNVLMKFPVGTSVRAYYPHQANPSGGSPSGTYLTTATVSSTGSLTFTGLVDGADYIAAAFVNGSWQYLRFTG